MASAARDFSTSLAYVAAAERLGRPAQLMDELLADAADADPL